MTWRDLPGIGWQGFQVCRLPLRRQRRSRRIRTFRAGPLVRALWPLELEAAPEPPAWSGQLRRPRLKAVSRPIREALLDEYGSSQSCFTRFRLAPGLRRLPPAALFL